MPANKRIMSEYPVKVKTVRNKKKKAKMDGEYVNDLKPRHQPYRRDAHHNFLLDDADIYDPVPEDTDDAGIEGV